MSHYIKCDIVSAEKTLYSDLVRFVVVPGENGEIGVFHGHAPLLTTLKAGPARLVRDNGEEDVLFISGGFVEVQPHKVIVLADSAIRASQLDESAALEAKKNAETLLQRGDVDMDYMKILKELNEASARLLTIEINRHR